MKISVAVGLLCCLLRVSADHNNICTALYEETNSSVLVLEDEFAYVTPMLHPGGLIRLCHCTEPSAIIRNIEGRTQLVTINETLRIPDDLYAIRDQFPNVTLNSLEVRCKNDKAKIHKISMKIVHRISPDSTCPSTNICSSYTLSEPVKACNGTINRIILDNDTDLHVTECEMYDEYLRIKGKVSDGDETPKNPIKYTALFACWARRGLRMSTSRQMFEKVTPGSIFFLSEEEEGMITVTIAEDAVLTYAHITCIINPNAEVKDLRKYTNNNESVTFDVTDYLKMGMLIAVHCSWELVAEDHERLNHPAHRRIQFQSYFYVTRNKPKVECGETPVCSPPDWMGHLTNYDRDANTILTEKGKLIKCKISVHVCFPEENIFTLQTQHLCKKSSLFYIAIIGGVAAGFLLLAITINVIVIKRLNATTNSPKDDSANVSKTAHSPTSSLYGIPSLRSGMEVSNADKPIIPHVPFEDYNNSVTASGTID